MRIARILLGLSLLLMAVNAFGQKVTTDSVPGTDWSKYHTYSWGEGTPAQDPLVAQRIVAGIDAQLAAKGLKKVENDPDLLVMYHAATDQQKSLNWQNYGGWGRFGGMGSAQVDTIITGQLKVDIADFKAKQFLWRGTATGTLSSDPQKNAKLINKALTKMFQKFPPSPGQ
jgi:uncharacterized protein DUF4136